jgi:ribulose-5-phosphate 4-epimerase/fuculose-1-phosphate aldolase
MVPKPALLPAPAPSVPRRSNARLARAIGHLGTPCESRAAATSLGSTSSAHDVAVELTAGLRLLDQGGQADLCAGFFSARHPDNPDFFLAPSHGTFWAEADPSIYGVYSCKTRERVAGNGPMPNFPSTAVSAAIYSAFPDVNAVVHAHPESVMAVSAADGPKGTILPISEPSFMFYQRVGSLPCNFFFDDDYLATIVDAMRAGCYCVMMRNHSYLMTGSSIQEAYIRSYMVEQSASVQLKMLASTGGVLPKIPDHEDCIFHRRSYEGYDGCPPYDGALEWPALVRSLDTQGHAWRGNSAEIVRELDINVSVA